MEQLASRAHSSSGIGRKALIWAAHIVAALVLLLLGSILGFVVKEWEIRLHCEAAQSFELQTYLEVYHCEYWHELALGRR